jgi:hypothetical protein
MNQASLIVPAAAAGRLCDDIRRNGQLDLETGGLLLAEPGSAVATVVAIAGTAGIIRGYGLFAITRPAFDAIFTWGEDRGLQVRAMVHSHAEEAFLSRTDREGGLRVKGFISAVVPAFADPPLNPSAWRWWIYASGWTPISAPATDMTARRTDAVVFDGDGVRAD